MQLEMLIVLQIQECIFELFELYELYIYILYSFSFCLVFVVEICLFVSFFFFNWWNFPLINNNSIIH